LKLRIIVAVSALALALGSVGAAAADPFLCPAVGNATAAEANGKGWGSLAETDGSFTFIPGNNQAGANSNPNAHNTLGPNDSPGPGDGNSDWSPIWPDE
jgi:hypothetical protein